LVLRYDTATGIDGLPGTEGAFTPCSFWYIEALTLSGQIDHARVLFEKMLGYSNHLGLYAEELGLSGEHLGNFPQALTHIALIQSALTLNDALEGKGATRNKVAGA
jgi:GH15 family glucan-1,4-alpha-glucosidase